MKPFRDSNHAFDLKRSALLGVGALVVLVGVGALRYSAAESDTPPPDGKQQIMDNVEASRAAAEQFAEEHPELLPSHSPGLHRLPESTLAPWPEGLFDPAGQLPGVDFRVDDEWQWDLEGNHVQVFAGTEFHPLRGAIIVWVTSMSLQTVPDLDGWYPAPVGVGSLHIVSYQGTLLTVQASTGETFYFDAESRAFTDASGNPVPTDTPTPTPPPLPTPEFTLPPIDFGSDTPTPTAAPTAQPTLAATAAAGG